MLLPFEVILHIIGFLDNASRANLCEAHAAFVCFLRPAIMWRKFDFGQMPNVDVRYVRLLEERGVFARTLKFPQTESLSFMYKAVNMSCFANVTTVNVSESSFRVNTFRAFTMLPKMSVLCLTDCKDVECFEFMYLSGCQNLRHLTILDCTNREGNFLDELWFTECVADLKKLTYLNVEGSFSFESYHVIKLLKELKFLEFFSAIPIEFNQSTCVVEEMMASDFPHVQFGFGFWLMFRCIKRREMREEQYLEGIDHDLFLQF